MTMRILGAFAAGLLLATPAAARLIVENANGYTLGVDGQLARFGTLVVGDDGKVEATLPPGSTATRRSGDRRLDARGQTLLPGLIDAHGHVLALGQRALAVDLSGAASLDAAIGAVRAQARRGGGGWVVGGGWNQERWGLGRFPTAAELDRAVSDRPAFLERIDGHAGWANSRALALAGITASTPDPVGGRIERDAGGAATGVLIDTAMALVSDRIPAPTAGQADRALTNALGQLAAVGLTGVHDAGITAADWSRYQRFAKAGKLTARIYAMAAGAAELKAAAPNGPTGWLNGDLLALSALKLQADGALGSRGARLKADYSDAPGQRGLTLIDDLTLRNTVFEATGKGFQVAIHAIGDAANSQVLTALATIPDAEREVLRPRLEHAQVIGADDMARVARLNVIASVQFTHATSDKGMAEARLGPQRMAGAYAWRALLASGARMAGGSDFPVEPPNPFFGLHAAVTRQDRAGQPAGGWRADQGLTVNEAFAAFTTGAAYAGFAEDKAGSLTPGKWADFILVDRDVFQVPPTDLWRVGVNETWLAGKRVFRRKG